MPTALATLRARLQIVLDDATAVLWTTAELDEHLQRALRDLSHHVPRQMKSALATVNGSRDIDIATLTNRVRVTAVEYKTGAFPPTFVNFSLWQDTLTIMEDPIPDGATANVFWEALHVVNGTRSLPEDHDETLLFQAAALACDQQVADTIDALTTGGPTVDRDWRSLAAHFRTRYDSRIRSRRSLRSRRLYAPDEPAPTQSTDPGP